MAMIGREAFEKLLKHKVTPQELEKIMWAYELSKQAHQGQVRDGGERYFEHPKNVTLILMTEFGVYDHEMIIASLLHDTVEDTYIFGDRNWHRLDMTFGPRVASLVRQLTKDKELSDAEKRQYVLSIVRSSEEDGEAVQLIKLADRLHNLRTIESCEIAKQHRVLEESIELFLPCAKRIGGRVYRKLYERCRVLQERCAPELASLLAQNK